MSDPIAIALLIILTGAVAWLLRARMVLRRQIARQTNDLAQANQAAENIKKDYEAKLTSTEQLRQALEQSNKRFELAQKAASDLLYDLDVASGALQWNDALYANYGYDRSEPAGTIEWWAAHVHSEDAMKLNEVMDGLAKPAATNWEVKYRFQKADGSYTWVRDRSFVLRDQQGSAVHLIGFMRDLSSDKQSITS